MVSAVADSSLVLHVGTDEQFARAGVESLPPDSRPLSLRSVETATAGWDRIDEGTVACVLCENELPNGDGTAFIRELRASYPLLPIVLLTEDPAAVDDALAAGATDTLVRHPETDGAAVLGRRLDTVVRASELPVDRNLDTLLDELHDIFFVLDASGQLVRWNSELERVSGYTGAELAGMDTLAFFEGEDRERVEAAIADVLESGSTKVRAAFTPKDGDPVPFDYTGARLADADGTVRGIVGIGRDVSERVERQRELRLKDRAMDRAPVGITISDPSQSDNPLIYANEEFTALTGYTDEEAVGRNCRFLQGEATDPDPVATLRDHIDAADPVSVELRNYRKDGTEFWNEVVVAPLRDGDGEVTNFVGFQQDITERKERELQLRLRERAMAEAPVGITIHDATAPNGPVTFVNEQFRALTGYDRVAVEGRDLSLLRGPDTDADRFEAVQRAFESGESVTEVLVCYREDGTPFWGRVGVAPVADDSGTVTHAVGFLQDITETKQHAETIERRLDEFGDILAAELHTPLGEALAHLSGNRSEADVAAAVETLEQADRLVDDLTEVHSFSVKSREVFEADDLDLADES